MVYSDLVYDESHIAWRMEMDWGLLFVHFTGSLGGGGDRLLIEMVRVQAYLLCRQMWGVPSRVCTTVYVMCVRR
jgi:hypothetical protein